MKHVRLIAILMMLQLYAVFAGGCTYVSGNDRVYIYERPAIGFTVEDRVITEVDLQRQSSLSFSTGDGAVKVTPYDGNKLKIIENRKLTGPASKKSLKSLLEENKLNVEKDTIDVKITNEAGGAKLKPLFRFIDDIELMVPETLKTVDVDAKSGGIEVSGLDARNILNLTLSKGSIRIDDSEAYAVYAAITNGDLDVNNFAGAGNYKCDRGNVKLHGIKGSIELKTLSGDVVIEKADGRLDCDISTGSLSINSSRIAGGSRLYTSTGKIDADFTDLDSTGRYTIKASKAQIKLKLSETAGWSLIAESSKGRIINKFGDSAAELKKAPSGEIYGDVRGGGPTVDVYTDMGSIELSG